MPCVLVVLVVGGCPLSRGLLCRNKAALLYYEYARGGQAILPVNAQTTRGGPLVIALPKATHSLSGCMVKRLQNEAFPQAFHLRARAFQSGIIMYLYYRSCMGKGRSKQAHGASLLRYALYGICRTTEYKASPARPGTNPVPGANRCFLLRIDGEAICPASFGKLRLGTSYIPPRLVCEPSSHFLQVRGQRGPGTCQSCLAG